MKWILFFCIVPWILFCREWNTVYLASFPRSGNHWVRFLVEEATHIATSSVYRDQDFPHLPDIFPWGGYCTAHGYDGHCRHPTKEDPVLLKTHYPFLPKKMDPNPTRAVCLIRHPIDSFWSFYVYRNTYQGVKSANRIDQEQLIEFIQGWKGFYEFWKEQSEVVFIRYEDLQENTAFCLKLILQTAGFSFDQTDIDRAVTKYPPQGKPLKHKDCYDAETITRIQEELSDLLVRFHYAM